MPERSTHCETLRAGQPIAVGPVTLLPIERIVLHANTGAAHGWFSAAKEPYALIVREAGGIRAIDCGAVAVSLEELREKVPELDVALAAM